MKYSFSIMVALLVYACVVCVSSPAFANDKKQAKKQFRAGVALLDVEDFEGAAEKFDASVKLFPTKNGLFNLANCYLALHRYEDALVTIGMLKTQFGEDIDTEWKEEISTFESKMEKEVVKLEILVNVDGAIVKVNGENVGSTPLDHPLIIRRGEHSVEVEQQGYKPEKRDVKLWDDKEATLRLTLTQESEVQQESADPEETEPVDDDPSGGARASTKKIIAWSSFGVAGATGVAAIITGSKQLASVDEIKNDCTNNKCDTSLKSKRDSASNLGVATNVLIGVAVAGAALGTVFLLLDYKEKKESNSIALVPAVLPSGAGLSMSGTF